MTEEQLQQITLDLMEQRGISKSERKIGGSSFNSWLLVVKQCIRAIEKFDTPEQDALSLPPESALMKRLGS